MEDLLLWSKAVDIGDNVSDISNILVGLPVDLPPGIPQV